MQIIPIDEGDPIVFALKGRLDTNAAPQLDRFAREVYARGMKHMVVDLEACEHISSAGLRVIVAMQKRAMTDGSLVFRNVSPDVMGIFRNVGFDKMLSIE